MALLCVRKGVGLHQRPNSADCSRGALASGGIAMKFWMHVRVAVLLLAPGIGYAAPSGFTVADALAFPFVDALVSAPSGDRIAWVRLVEGVRNVWVADAPGFVPRQVTKFTADDGQELTQLTFSSDGKTLVFARGGDHDANWPAAGNLQPNPTSGTSEAKVTLWHADPTGAKPAGEITEGDAPALSSRGKLAFVKNGQVWTSQLDGSGAVRLFFDRGKDSALTWSKDGTRLAFVSSRDDHSFIGVYSIEGSALAWMAPTTNYDAAPIWSPGDDRIAFTRRPGRGGPPDSLIDLTPQPWSIWVADVASGGAKRVWASPKTLRGSYPDVAGEANLHWLAGDRIGFLSMMDNWPHLYAVPARGGAAQLLTPGNFMVEHVAASPDGSALIYSANTGVTADDDDRRHLYRVGLDGSAPVALTSGDGLEWTPVGVSGGAAFVTAGVRTPPAIAVVKSDEKAALPRVLAGQAPPANFSGAQFVVPRQVSFRAPDGLLIHGQLFSGGAGRSKKPAVVFVHGGPPRQMMLGFSYMRYYSNAYAMNQYLAAHGFDVLSVNYRLGIGYGWDFQHPEKGGPAGSSEYQDVLAGGRYLQGLAGVDPARIGIWGGSYGGLLTALALARNSDVFKAGVDFHGVHDWSRILGEEVPLSVSYEQGDRAKAAETAFKSSPVADVASWTSPVLLIHGDDDRNVRVNQTIDLARRLDAKGVEYEELVIPDDIHDFLLYCNWLRADTAMAEFLTRRLGAE